MESLVVAAMTVSGPSAPLGPVPASQEPATNSATSNVAMALESGEVPSETVCSARQSHQKHVDIGKEKPQRLSEDDFLRFHQAWQQEFADIVNGMKEELPPWREVNHEINLIDEGK
ncbi:hypothetical protein C0995_012577, partial [Termitomyces sp. Mi166